MNTSEDRQYFPRISSIPKVFWSDLENQPFQECINCQAKLVEGNTPYLIEKSVRGFNGNSISATVFEYAVCVACASQMQMKLSISSRSNITNYFKEHVDFENRLEELLSASDEDWLKKCLIKNKEVNGEEECQIYGLCQGEHFIYKEFPYMISGEALDEMMDLISAETLRELDDFKKELIDGPPELRELFDKVGPRMLI